MKLLEALRSEIEYLEEWVSANRTQLINTRLDMEASVTWCDLCASKMLVQKTVTRTVITLAHNRFKARERVLVCPKGCAHPNGMAVTVHDQALAGLAPPGSNYGYDVEVFVGMARYVRRRQREETRTELYERYGVSISSSEISVLARRFLWHFEALHQSSAEKIRLAIQQDGGYTMHIDATTEDGKGTLLVIFNGWRRWVLGAWKIPSESKAAIEPCITETVSLFGEPLAIVRDLGSPMANAVELAVSKMSSRPKILACHFHFLRDIGNDILKDGHGHLRKMARRYTIRSNIRHFIQTLYKKADADDISYAKNHFKEINRDGEFPSIPGYRLGFAFIIVLAKWILDYTNDSKNLGFPFDRPYYNLYQRCTTASLAIDDFLSEWRFDYNIDKALERFKSILSPYVNDKDILKAAQKLQARMELFDKFRAIFRLESQNPGSAKTSFIFDINNITGMIDSKLAPEYMREELDIRNKINSFCVALKKRYNAVNTKKDLKRAIKIIIDHLERHGQYLWGHLASLSDNSSDKKFRLIDRTNNVLEIFFHHMKHGERRRSGRKILTRDFECVPPAAALALNLSDHDYVKTVCGSLDNLPHLFSIVECEYRDELNNTVNEPANVYWLDDDEGISVSDKLFVRKDFVGEWILAASQGRRIDNLKSVESTIKIPFEEMSVFLEKALS